MRALQGRAVQVHLKRNELLARSCLKGLLVRIGSSWSTTCRCENKNQLLSWDSNFVKVIWFWWSIYAQTKGSLKKSLCILLILSGSRLNVCLRFSVTCICFSKRFTDGQPCKPRPAAKPKGKGQVKPKGKAAAKAAQILAAALNAPPPATSDSGVANVVRLICRICDQVIAADDRVICKVCGLPDPTNF